jgi:hypothetical protein
MENEVVYRFSKSALCVGDVMLSRHQTAIVSKAIRVATWSRFSHAAICHRPPEFLEAIPSGVCRFTGARFFFRNPKSIAVLRLKPSFGVSPEALRAAIEEALRFLGNDYSVSAAIGTAVPWTISPRNNGVFCSQLVAGAFQRANVSLFRGRRPSKITPGAIHRCRAFEDVTEQVLEPVAHHVASLFLIPYGEGSYASRHGHEVLVGRKVRDQVNEWLATQHLPVQPNFHELWNMLRDGVSGVQQRVMDRVFTEALMSSGYLHLVDDLYPSDDPTFQATRMLEDAKSNRALDPMQLEGLRQMYREQYVEHQGALQEQTQTREWLENAWRSRGLETFRLLYEHQQKVCLLGHQISRQVERADCLLRDEPPRR